MNCIRPLCTCITKSICSVTLDKDTGKCKYLALIVLNSKIHSFIWDCLFLHITLSYVSFEANCTHKYDIII